jgi:hypothetical protein
MKTFVIFALFALSGCASCREHPVMCGLVSAIAVGTVVATIEQNQPDHRHAVPVDCISPFRGGTLKPGCAQ